MSKLKNDRDDLIQQNITDFEYSRAPFSPGVTDKIIKLLRKSYYGKRINIKKITTIIDILHHDIDKHREIFKKSTKNEKHIAHCINTARRWLYRIYSKGNFENDVKTLLDSFFNDFKPYIMSENGFKFTSDWTSDFVDNWRIHLEDFKDKLNSRFLEIGVYEGRSLIWFFKNIFIHPSSRAVCIDTFEYYDDQEHFFKSNIENAGLQSQVLIHKDQSQKILHALPPKSFDFIYVDGAHDFNGALQDAKYSWPLLKKDGIIIFDDFKRGKRKKAVEKALCSFIDRLPKPDYSIEEAHIQLVLKKKI